MVRDLHERVVLGVELESYTIQTPEYRISRELAFPRKGVGEKGERFGRDWSIGTEYNSPPFQTIRQGLFLLKAGLRKYSRKLYRRKSRSRKGRQLLLVGGWRDRFAGTHIHLSLDDGKLAREEARHLAWHLHDHIPLLVALGANSPVWADELTELSSNRIARASRIYFRPVRRAELTSRSMDEIVLSRGRKTKPPTLEIRVMDSNLPEFVMAAACVVKAVALAWRSGRKAANRIPHTAYLRARADAARLGMKSRLCWNGEWMTASRYLDRFVWTFRDELAQMDVPHEVWIALKLLKKGYNGSRIIAEAARLAYEEHPQTWQRRFAKRYVGALDHLLSGNSILDFVDRLHVQVPDLSGTWLGRHRLKLL
jgi:Glutamate-cysteine ligase family 2(GCS2)